MDAPLSPREVPLAPAVTAKVDYAGITVSSLADTLHFWVNVLGFRHLYTWEFENNLFIEDLVGVKGADLTLAMVEGYGQCVELLEYRAPIDRKVIKPRSCDVGSVYIGLYVDDMECVLARVREAGWTSLSEPVTVRDCERAGLRLVYVRSPDGVTLEFLQFLDWSVRLAKRIIPRKQPAL
jgi:catechol 2,3-dioxygenase-like lactoylglutathione lyase family enzyme